jgi:hypothetical protein
MVHVVSAMPLSDYRLEVTFNDGVSGIFHVEPKRRGGVFLKLLDEQVFNAVTINPDFGCVEWAGSVDLDPEAMHRTLTGLRSKEEEPSAAILREEVDGNQ